MVARTEPIILDRSAELGAPRPIESEGRWSAVQGVSSQLPLIEQALRVDLAHTQRNAKVNRKNGRGQPVFGEALRQILTDLYPKEPTIKMGGILP